MNENMVRNKHNTPGIVKFSFWQMDAKNPAVTYACINLGETRIPKEIAEKSICINRDIGDVLTRIKVLAPQ